MIRSSIFKRSLKGYEKKHSKKEKKNIQRTYSLFKLALWGMLGLMGQWNTEGQNLVPPPRPTLAELVLPPTLGPKGPFPTKRGFRCLNI